MKNIEHNLQSACVKWFRLQYPKLAMNLFAIPNGAKRDPRSGKWYKAEGMTAGVPDCLLLSPDLKGEYHGVGIEFKSEKGKQTDAQKNIELAMLDKNYAYWIIRSFEQFKYAIENYLN